MRIISGIRKGLKLKAPDGQGTRPTTDRVKESVFNIIQTYLPADRVLDLFAGSGALGLEAVSRRSLHCVFVENDRRAFQLVRENISLASFEEWTEPIFSDSLTYLDTNPAPFDIIFLDPPYNKGLLAIVLDKISKNGLLNHDGIIVAETEKDGEVAEHSDYDTLKCVTYGKTVVSVLKQSRTSMQA